MIHNQLFAWRLGGAQGSGIETMAGLFARTCVSLGLQVSSRREYHSNIKGRHSYYDIAISSGAVLSHCESPDMLVCLDAESLCRHIRTVQPGGSVVFNIDDVGRRLDELALLERPLKGLLSDAGDTISALLDEAQARNVSCFGIPLATLSKRLADAQQITERQAERLQISLMVAISSALLAIPISRLLVELATTFSQRDAVLAWNEGAVALAYQHVQENQLSVEAGGGLPVADRHGQARMLLNGYQAVALGKLAGGLGMQTYYPISPATDESEYLEQHCRIVDANGIDSGPLIVQVEDELAAVNMASGAALTGARSATSTSGPGFSLMTEGIGWAGMNEVPLVISLYQRGGPSTGMPTRTEQGDLAFAVHGGHGEFPRMVLASGDVSECFYDSFDALNYAERFQLPVIHMLDKALTSTLQSVAPLATDGLSIRRGPIYQSAGSDGHTPRFGWCDDGISPRAVVGQAAAQHWTTGVEHDVDGLVSENPLVREAMMEKRAGKLDTVLARLVPHEKWHVYGEPDAEFTVLTWGSNKGAVLDAMRRLKNSGVAMRMIQLRLLWPFPSAELKRLLAMARPLVVVECNHTGQLAELLREQAGISCQHRVLKYNGRPFSGEGLGQILAQILHGKGEPRMVAHNPYE